MKFYTKQHKYYCGIDLHTKRMYVCILDAGGNIRIHQNINTDPEAFLSIITPFREDVVVAGEKASGSPIKRHLSREKNIP